MSPRPTRWRDRRRRARASARARSAMCWASSKAYTTRVGEGPFPTELTDAHRREAGRARRRIRHRDGAQAPLRLVRRGAGAPDRDHRRHRRHRAHQARRAGRLRRDQALHRLPAGRAQRSIICPPTPTNRRALDAHLRNAGRLERIHPRRAQLGASFPPTRSNMCAASRN